MCLLRRRGFILIMYLSEASSPPVVQDISVCRTVTPSAAMGIIAPRDFVDVIVVKEYEDGAVSSNGTLCFIFLSCDSGI